MMAKTTSDTKVLVLDRLVQAIRFAVTHNPDLSVPPACILWPDKDRQWATILPRLLVEMPELLILGEFDAEKRTGPAIWLRCAILGKNTPIIYLPGIGRQDLRAVESCPDFIKPIAELQYRGTLWSQVNGKDWTILAFLKSDQGGLGLDIAQDHETKQAMQLAFYLLLDEKLETLTGKRLDQEFFNTLLSGGDPIRDCLQWLDRGDAFRQERDEQRWRGFVEICKSRFKFDPGNDGPLVAGQHLAENEGPWQAVWERFREAPTRYTNIPSLLRRIPIPQDLFTDRSGWPQWNEQQENSLRRELLSHSSKNNGLQDSPNITVSKFLFDALLFIVDLLFSLLEITDLALTNQSLILLLLLFL